MAIPSINDLVTYVNTKLTGVQWNANWAQLITWLTDGNADLTVDSITVDTITSSNFTGDLVGDVKATDGTKVLENGLDGTDATFTGDVTGAIIGVTDGSSAAAGEVGEVIKYDVALVTQVTPVLGTFYDGITGCTLTAGRWLVSVSGTVSLNGVTQDTTAEKGAIATLALTDNSNTILEQKRDGYANTAIDTSISDINIVNYEINIASPTTYKVRFSTLANSGTPTVTSLDFSRSESGNRAKFVAVRI